MKEVDKEEYGSIRNHATVTKSKYYKYYLFKKTIKYIRFLHAGKLFKQWLVHQAIKMKFQNLIDQLYLQYSMTVLYHSGIKSLFLKN